MSVITSDECRSETKGSCTHSPFSAFLQALLESPSEGVTLPERVDKAIVQASALKAIQEQARQITREKLTTKDEGNQFTLSELFATLHTRLREDWSRLVQGLGIVRDTEVAIREGPVRPLECLSYRQIAYLMAGLSIKFTEMLRILTPDLQNNADSFVFGSVPLGWKPLTVFDDATEGGIDPEPPPGITWEDELRFTLYEELKRLGLDELIDVP